MINIIKNLITGGVAILILVLFSALLATFPLVVGGLILASIAIFIGGLIREDF